MNAFGGITGLKRGDSSATFATEFVNGGKTKWVRVNSKEDGSVEVKYDVNEGLLTDMVCYDFSRSMVNLRSLN